MTIKVLRLIALVSASLWLSGCVTTTKSPYDDKKDLEKAVLTYTQIGYGYFEQGKLLEAKTALTKALDIDSSAPGAHLGMARVYDRELEHKLADSHFKKAVRYGGESEIHFQYGVYLYNRADLKGAFSEFKKTLEDTVYVRRAQAFEYQGLVASRLGKEKIAISSYERAIALNKMMSNSYIGLTNIYFDRQEFAKSYHHFNGFIALVRAQLARHNSNTVWLGIQLADKMADENAISSLSIQLRNQFPDSKEYQLYLKWKAEKDAS